MDKNDLLNLISNSINWIILSIVFVKSIGTQCFNLFDTSASFIGLIISVFIFIVQIINKYYKEVSK